MGKGRFSLWTLLTWLSAAIHRGLDAGGESVMTRRLRARAKAAIHSSLCLFGKRKGVCGLSLGKQSRDSVQKDRPLGWVSPSSHATCLCVSGDQGDPGTGHDWQLAIPTRHRFTSPLHPLHSHCQVAEDSPEIHTHDRPVHVRRRRQVKSLARRAAAWDSCYLPAWFMPCAVE